MMGTISSFRGRVRSPNAAALCVENNGFAGGESGVPRTTTGWGVRVADCQRVAKHRQTISSLNTMTSVGTVSRLEAAPSDADGRFPDCGRASTERGGELHETVAPRVPKSLRCRGVES